MMNYEQKIITHYSPISARGGRKLGRKLTRKKLTRKRRNNKSKKVIVKL